jgi:dihydrofolate synthase/folylpolyglutamate synthase
MCSASDAYAAIIPDCAGAVEINRSRVVRVEKNGVLVLSDGRAVTLEGIRLPEQDSQREQALTALRDRLPVTAQSVRNGLSMVELPGRFQIVPGQPTLVLDVAHNPHSVAALAENLDAMGFYPCTHAVFGAMADKDLAPMLARVAPLIDKWYFTDLPTPRAATAADLQVKWTAANTRPDAASGTYKSPEAALQAAVKAATPADRIVVFGSFYTVGGILKDGVPRLSAPHLAT